MAFETLQDAAHALLMSTCGTLNEAGSRYEIAGGWIPVIRGGASDLTHPGTRDVDALFPDEPEYVLQAAQALLESGYVPSAKHEFQLLRTIVVGGQPFVFNVDLMHPGDQFATGRQMFHDVFEFNIPDSYDPTGKRWLKSILLGASSAIIFEQGLWGNIDVEGISVEAIRN